jgi:hypothetical protein
VGIMELGALGEFIGAIAVVVTLIYLAVQIRQNTRSMDESRKLALAQTYQIRADALQDMLVQAADSTHLSPIIIKLTEAGYPEDIAALHGLSTEERGRFRLWQIAQLTHWDNMFYQYEHGFLDEEYFEDNFKARVQRLAPTWEALNLTNPRRSFGRQIDEIRASR